MPTDGALHSAAQKKRKKNRTSASSKARGGRVKGSSLSSAERHQRISAARNSARKRKGTGKKDKHPTTRETKAKEKTRRRSNQDKPKKPKVARFDAGRPKEGSAGAAALGRRAGKTGDHIGQGGQKRDTKGEDREKMALAGVASALNSGKSVKMNAREMMDALGKAKKRGLQVTKTGSRSASIQLKDGRKPNVEAL